ncbi:MarR family winged helix-turn-helix transcriptional regulator [Nonomuraea sp. CA-141351]|uniref:MarR family winged helix-turn-helix transcriptional regulator n=1 Tax=Nonomuraea sp. CA-141351 TaxID=3239996 RepID=UPI003D8DF70C
MDTEAGRAGDGAPLAGYTGHLLRRIYGRAVQTAHAVLPVGFQPRDFAILGALAERDATSQHDLAEKLKINRTMMVKVVDKLEDAGYVVRRRNPQDRRSYALSVTPAGRRALAEAAPAFSRAEQSLTQPLSGRERERLTVLLRQLMPEVATGLPEGFRGHIGYLLNAADRRLRQFNDAALGVLGIQMRHFTALAALAEAGPVAQQELARMLALTEPAMVQIVDELETAGLAERGRDRHDRRRYALTITGKGAATLAEARQAMDANQQEVVATLGELGDVELRTLLTKMIDAPGPAESHPDHEGS